MTHYWSQIMKGWRSHESEGARQIETVICSICHRTVDIRLTDLVKIRDGRHVHQCTGWLALTCYPNH